MSQFFGKHKLSSFLEKKKIKYHISNKNIEKKILGEISPTSIGISYRYSFIFSKKIIKRFNNHLFNIHSQNLPQFRGKGGFTWNILKQSNVLGSTIHLVSSKIDKGLILMKIKKKYNLQNRTYDDVEKKVYKIDQKIIKNFINKILQKNKFRSYRFSSNLSYYWPSLKTKKNAWINFEWGQENVINFINGFSGKFGGALSYCDKKIIRLQSARKPHKNEKFHPYQVGIVFRIIKNRIFIACEDGAVTCNYYLHNNEKIKIGSRINTPVKKLEQSLINL